MARRSKSKIFKQAVEVAKSKKLFFIEQVVAFLPIVKETFYKYFPLGSDEMDSIKEILEQNRIEIKSSMLKKWYDSDAPALQISLFKLVGTDDERKILSTNWNENNHSGGINIQVVTENPELDKKIENLGK